MDCEDIQLSNQEPSDIQTQKASRMGGLTILNQINQANFPVFLAYTSSSKQHFALKVFPYKDHKVNPFFLNEAQFAGLAHKNVISVAHLEPEKIIPCRNKRARVSYIVMELAPYGDFFDVLMTKRIAFDDKLARTYFHHLIQGLEYLHSNRVAHLDIKPENLLVGDNFQLKIADFDHSSLKGKCSIPSLGTANYRAPEMVNGLSSEAADIYSAAIMLFLFKTGCLPYMENTKYQNMDFLELLQEGRSMFWRAHCEIQGKPLSFFDKDFRVLFSAMTKFDPLERPSLEQIKDSEWYRGPVYTDEELAVVMAEKFNA